MSIFPKALVDHARTVITLCRDLDLTVTTAESCTGGLVSASLTAIPGSSEVLDRAFVTYSNAAKMQLLGVESELLETVGAVSEEVAVAMALGALAASGASLALSITGIAGPSGGSPEKPVGLVYMAAARQDGLVRPKRYVFAGSRDDIRLASVHAGFDVLVELAKMPDDEEDDEGIAPPTPDKAMMGTGLPKT